MDTGRHVTAKCRCRPSEARPQSRGVGKVAAPLRRADFGLKLSEKMRTLIEEQRLCFAATVCPDGSPNLSPKGTVFVWDDTTLAFFDLASPQTVENLKRDGRIELNVVDQRTRTGFRFKGAARVTSSSADLLEARTRYPRNPPNTDRIRAVVIIEVAEARPLISPAYELTERPEEIAMTWENYWVELWGSQTQSAEPG
jgi:uncharacterized protein